MRYRDAEHVDLGSFYARSPHLGRMYRLIGYAAVIVACYFHNDVLVLERLLIAVVVAWLMAWYRIVGALWRGPLVAAALLIAVLLTFHHAHVTLPVPGQGVLP